MDDLNTGLEVSVKGWRFWSGTSVLYQCVHEVSVICTRPSVRPSLVPSKYITAVYRLLVIWHRTEILVYYDILIVVLIIMPRALKP